MKDRLKIIYIILAFLLTSCAMEEAFEPEVVPEVETELPDSVFFILADPAPLTRVTYAGDGLHADFEKEDLVGCFALNDDLTAAEGEGFKPNACYRVSVHTNIKDGKDRRFLSPVTDSDDLNKSKTKYLFYYPYDPEITSLDQLKAYTHSVNTDQNDRDRYEASDLLWDICTPIAELKSVEVEMDHAMAQIIVEVESKLIKEGTVPTLLNIPTTVSKLNLVKLNLDAMTSGLHEAGAYELSTAVDNVVMWEFGYATSGNLMFRAAVPANHTISSGSKILSLENPDGNKVTYRLSKDLSFEPGKTYRMTLVKERQVVTPDVSDDETWVLDVVDPQTMQPIGLLCREYLRFQPTDDNDLQTGTIGVNPDDGTDTKYINSQAWVFYELDEKTGIPNLNQGTVVRFIYDAIYAYSKWPDPHKHVQWGYFLADHGHDWDTEKGESSESMDEYYMHGGVIHWEETAKDNIKYHKIVHFDMPAKRVSNAEAMNAHIVIDQSGSVSISYDAVVGMSARNALLIPHYLIDRRLNNVDYTIEEVKYPLVKIGYNQFWMSKSLNTEMLVDGSPLVCYNSDGDTPGVNFTQGVGTDTPGYIFPFTQAFTDKDGTSVSYNPYKKLEQRKGDNGYTATRVYNKLAVNNPSIISASYDDRFYYKVPELSDMYNIEYYFAYIVGGMFMSQNIPTRTEQNDFEGNWLDILLRGQYFSSSDGNLTNTSAVSNVYAANISGFNFYGIGYYEPAGQNFASPIGSAAMLLKSPDPGVNYYIINSWDAFKDSTPKLFQSLYSYNESIANQFFAQIRFIMKYRGQDDTPDITISSTFTKSSSAPVESRDVYVGLEAVEE